jgi:hypothetical protein
MEMNRRRAQALVASAVFTTLPLLPLAVSAPGAARDEKTITGFYVPLPGFLVSQNEAAESRKPSVAYNAIKSDPQGAADVANPNFRHRLPR